MKEYPLEDRPYEKLASKGAESLTLAELLSVLLQNGIKGKSALALSQVLVQKLSCNNLNPHTSLGQKTWRELAKEEGIGKVKALRILAALELGKRVFNSDVFSNNIRLQSPNAIANYMQSHCNTLETELFYCLFLNIKNDLLSCELISRGKIGATSVDIQQIVRKALSLSCFSVVAVHNHPSGSVDPSQADLYATSVLFHILSMHDIVLLDHIIIGKKKYCSLRQEHPSCFSGQIKVEGNPRLSSLSITSLSSEITPPISSLPLASTENRNKGRDKL